MAKTTKKTTKAKKTKTAKKSTKKAQKTSVRKAAKKITKKAARKASAGASARAPGGMMFPASFNLNAGASEDDILGSAFEKIIARGNERQQSPVCYSQLADGQWEICLLQSDGSYGQCKRYNGPVHTPVCGG